MKWEKSTHFFKPVVDFFKLIFKIIVWQCIYVTFDFPGRNIWEGLIPLFTSLYNKSAYVVVKTKKKSLFGVFLQNICWLFFPHMPGPAGKIMQVFACRKTQLIREQTRQWKPICRYFQVKLLKRLDYGMIHSFNNEQVLSFD